LSNVLNMYLARVYTNPSSTSAWSIRKIELKDILQWMVDQMEKPWTKMTLIDCTHRTVVIVWKRGSDGRPQHPVLPGMKHG